jgi:hypothetical protein
LTRLEFEEVHPPLKAKGRLLCHIRKEVYLQGKGTQASDNIDYVGLGFLSFLWTQIYITRICMAWKDVTFGCDVCTAVEIDKALTIAW